MLYGVSPRPGACALLLAGLSAAAPALALAAPAPTPAKPAAAPARPAPDETVQGLVITAQPADGVASIDRRSYTIGRDLQATTGSIADTLRSVPSLQVDVEGGLTLRGDPNVTIMVDGKPSAMFSGPNRGQMLQQLPAGQFERIEVMTNPSAAFSPEGTGGVVNLVTKQNRGLGRTGSVRANVGTDERRNIGLTLSDNRPDLTLSGDLAVRRDPISLITETDRSRLDPANGGFAKSRQTGKQSIDQGMTTGRLALNYDFDADNRVNADIRYTHVGAEGLSASSFDGSTGTGAPFRNYGVVGRVTVDRSFLAGSADWRRRFGQDGHDLTLRVSRDRNTGDQTAVTSYDFRFPAGSPQVESLGANERTVLAQAKAEYRRPFRNGDRLIAGYELQVSDNDYDNLTSRGAAVAALVVDPGRTNRFAFDQTVHAFYGTFQHRFGKLGVLPGIRLEEVEVGTHQVTSAIEDDYSYFRVYPTLHLDYALGEGAQINAGYSRRVQRPAAQDLNPFRIYQSIDSFRQGDSRLKPQVTDSFELGYQLRKGTTFYQANAYARFAKDGVTDLIQDLGNNVFLTRRANLAKARTVGLELVANGRITSKITYNLNANGFWNEVTSADPIFTGKRSGFAVTGYGALNLQLTPDDFVQVSGNAQGRQVLPQGYRLPSGMLNLGYRHRFSPRLNGVVTVQDALGTLRDVRTLDTSTLVERRYADVRLRGVFIGLTYSFGGNGRPAAQPQGFDFGGGGGGGVP
jgi:outer membrane receptor protein involved in Fe transport